VKELCLLSLPFSKEPLEVDGHSSGLDSSVKHFFQLIFQSILNAYHRLVTQFKPLGYPWQRRRIIERIILCTRLKTKKSRHRRPFEHYSHKAFKIGTIKP
ncbi:hypothetical protein AB4274_15185, partial [Vibrio sp. 10N.261.55.A10]